MLRFVPTRAPTHAAVAQWRLCRAAGRAALAGPWLAGGSRGDTNAPLFALQVCDRQLTDANRNSIREFCQVNE